MPFNEILTAFLLGCGSALVVVSIYGIIRGILKRDGYIMVEAILLAVGIGMVCYAIGRTAVPA